MQYDLKKITSEYFETDHLVDKKRELFKKIVRLVEVEPHSYCNRTCWFCPNSTIDRRATVKFLEEDSYLSLLNDLSLIDYDGMIAFARYAEPFANEVFYQRLAQARKILPNALLHTNTNADYLNNESLVRAYESGLRSINIQVYLNDSELFTLENIQKHADKIAKRLSNVEINLKNVGKSQIDFQCTYMDMSVKMYARDFTHNGVDRSDIKVHAQSSIRLSPCTFPFHDVVIDYNGNVVPCCNMRSDYEKHAPFIVGNIKNNSIYDIFFSQKMVSFRKGVFSYSEKKYPCTTCNFNEVDFDTLYIDHIRKNFE